MSARVSSEDPAAVALCLDELRQGLALKRLNGQLHYFPEIDSTNTVARRLADSGVREGDIVIAEAQTRGRGRLGRQWQSPPFANLYFSVILRPSLPAANAPQITLMAAVALAETVDRFISQSAAIKWPNDILVDGKKLAGILTEASCDAAGLQYVILGIGVNLNYRFEAMPEELRQSAISVTELTGKSVRRESFFGRLIHALDRCYGELEESGFARLAPRWEAHFALRGRMVRVELFGESITGTAIGIDQDGALMIEDAQGTRHRVLAGDVIPVEN
jgi:BirA family transcriptional regulator, biotin operon repressor / biotin---[acetyl-CoA-carboxylase] ligase